MFFKEHTRIEGFSVAAGFYETRIRCFHIKGFLQWQGLWAA